MGGDEFPLTIPSPGIEEVIESLREVGIEVVPGELGESAEYVTAIDENGKKHKLPRNFNIFTNNKEL